MSAQDIVLLLGAIGGAMVSVGTLAFTVFKFWRQDDRENKREDAAVKRDEIATLQAQLARMDARLEASEREQDRLRSAYAEQGQQLAVSLAKVAQLEHDVRGWQARHAEQAHDIEVLRTENKRLREKLIEQRIEVPPLQRASDNPGA